MALPRIQKKGRVIGNSPVEDARVIDQFMDDVIAAMSQTNVTLGDVVNNITIVNNNSRINRFIEENVNIPDLICVLQRNPILADGVTIDVEDGGELLLL